MEKVELANLGTTAREVLGRVAAKGAGATLLTLQGNLGAGKTTFVQALGRELGVVGPIQSPTYVLMKSYPISFAGFTTLVHIDAYRLEEPGQFAALRPQEFLTNPQNLVVVEWPEKLEGVLPKPDTLIRFASEAPDSTQALATERYIEVITSHE